MQLTTERLVLRKPRREDGPALLDFVGDTEVMHWIGSEPGGIEVANEHLERWLRRWEANDMGYFVLERDGLLLGRVGATSWNGRTWEASSLADAGEDAQVELGWALTTEHWGRGYATEAARAVREWLYASRDVERLVSLIDPENTKSARVAERLGAVPTETAVTEYGSFAVWVHPR